MNDREQMWAAIKADPLDDTVRLVFADWLDEQGNRTDSNQAAFIRAQIELSKIGPRPIMISSMLRSYGPDYWSAMLSDWDDDVKVGDRVDFEEEARITPKGKPGRKLRKFSRLRVVKVEVDDPALSTRIVYLARDEYSTPWPEARVKELTKLCDAHIRSIPTGGIDPNGMELIYDRGFISKLRMPLPIPEMAVPINLCPITDVEFTFTPLLVREDAPDRRHPATCIGSLGPAYGLSVQEEMAFGDEVRVSHIFGVHFDICRAILRRAFPSVPNWRFVNDRQD